MSRYLVAVDGSPATPDPATIQRMLADGSLLWLDLRQPDSADLAMLTGTFGVHPLALENTATFGQRPKLHDYDDLVYLAAYGATESGGDLVEVHFLLAERFLVTVAQEKCEVLDQARQELAASGGGRHRGRVPPRVVLLHRLLDALTDTFFPALADFDDRIDDLQGRIFGKPTNDELAELFSMQRWLVGVRKLVAPERDMLSGLVSGMVSLPGMTAKAEPYLRDLYDHLIRISDEVDSYRDLLSNAMDVYLSTVSNRLNEVMKQLAVIATVFLPLSFLTGFFGQNFSWLVGHLSGVPAFLVLGIGTEVAAAAGLFILFRRRGWL